MNKEEDYILKLFEKYESENKEWNAMLFTLLDEVKNKLIHYKKLAKANLDDLKKVVQQDKELKESLDKIFTAIVKAPVEKPEMLYEYKDEPMSAKELAKWYDLMELYYHQAQRYEEQERGLCCCVDRAYGRYLIPECKKLLEQYKSQLKQKIRDLDFAELRFKKVVCNNWSEVKQFLIKRILEE